MNIVDTNRLALLPDTSVTEIILLFVQSVLSLPKHIPCLRRQEVALFAVTNTLAPTQAGFTVVRNVLKWQQLCEQMQEKYTLAKCVKEPLMRSMISLTANFTFREEKH